MGLQKQPRDGCKINLLLFHKRPPRRLLHGSCDRWLYPEKYPTLDHLLRCDNESFYSMKRIGEEKAWEKKKFWRRFRTSRYIWPDKASGYQTVFDKVLMRWALRHASHWQFQFWPWNPCLNVSNSWRFKGYYRKAAILKLAVRLRKRKVKTYLLACLLCEVSRSWVAVWMSGRVLKSRN